MDPTPVLELQNVFFEYPLFGSEVVPVLKNISLKVRKGEFVAIQGPSGSGKSTLLYILGLLHKPTRGNVLFEGRSTPLMTEDALAQLRNRSIGFVFQQFHLLPKASVLENVLLPSLYSHEPNAKEYALELLEKIGLSDRLEHHPNQCSGGQQQRVAIARALLNKPKLILADEPTGNLDSKSTEDILKLLKHLHAEGNTILLITHDSAVAAHAERIITIRDGQIEGAKTSEPGAPSKFSPPAKGAAASARSIAEKFRMLSREIRSSLKWMPLALENLKRYRARSILTMLGVTIGVCALLSMVTIGQYVKRKLLDSYAELGVNTVVFHGHRGWERKAVDVAPLEFSSFSWERDLKPLKRIFPEIQHLSPVMHQWRGKVSYGGKAIETEVRIMGVNQDIFQITERDILMGGPINEFHVDSRMGVCLIGYEIGEKLFTNVSPVGQIIQAQSNETIFGCRIVGVMAATTSNKDWMKPNLQLLVPFTFFEAIFPGWDSEIRQFMISFKDGTDVERTAKGIRAFFEKKYGSSGEFREGFDSVMIAQMKKFLILFTVMLASIALICLGVGGIGIANMMLVSVSERIKEIGLRKAIGATHKDIRNQMLLESTLLCSIAGAIGIAMGLVIYESVIFAISKFMPKVPFEFVVEWGAMILSLVSILAVGILSGMVPALKAERLQIVEALRSE